MLPFRLVGPKDPKAMPMACLCGNGRGTLVDTLIQKNGLGRVYLCGRCCREIGVLRGYLPGEKAEQLDRATELLAQKELDVEHMAGQIRDQEARLAEANGRIEQLLADLDDAHAREKQAADRLNIMLGQAQATLEAVGG